MFLNELPEECLLIIFDLINELDDLVNCYKVCCKWSHLIVERTRKVKYLIGDWPDEEPFPSYPLNRVYYRTEEPIDGTCLDTLFANLMVADFCTKFCKKVGYEDIVAWVKKIKSLKGIIGSFYKGDKSIFQYCDQLEMVATSCEWYIEPCLKKNGAGIKQLEIWGCSLDTFMEDAEYFPNLERLLICHSEDWPAGYYTNGAILSRLKIVGLSLNNYSHYIYHGFKFINSCPNLQSAHIRLYSNHICVDESMKHESLQDLVLQFYSDDICWNQLKELLKKYPNLKHLALRECNSLRNETMLQLINILPNLVLFDVRGCRKVTQEAANYIQNYNIQHGRTIKFYFDGNYHKIQSDWPQLSTKWEIISQGFDFMKHCFLKDFDDLPTFLIPSED